MNKNKTYIENGIVIEVLPLMGRPYKHRLEPTASQEPELPNHTMGRSWKEVNKTKLTKLKKAETHAKSIAYKLKND
jgi:hypothetical protein